MVKGETGTLSLDVRTSVDKGVSALFSQVCQSSRRSCFINKIGLDIIFSPTLCHFSFYPIFISSEVIWVQIILYCLIFSCLLCFVLLLSFLQTCVSLSVTTEEGDVLEERLLLHYHQRDTVQVCLVLFSYFRDSLQCLVLKRHIQYCLESISV